MARGETETTEKQGIDLAIWAIFGVVFLLVVFLVTWSAIDTTEATPPYTETDEPFVGAETTLQMLTWRGCSPGSGVFTGGNHPTQIANALHADLEARGYISETQWSEPTTLPLSKSFAQYEGACGVVAAVGDASSFLSGTSSGPACVHAAATVGVCGASEVSFQGSGNVRLRFYLMPGLTESTVHTLEMDAELALAHAEAEVLLSRANWIASNEIIKQPIPSSPAFQTFIAPGSPSSGCVPFVAAGRTNNGSTNVLWLGRHISSTSVSPFLVGLLKCAHTGPMGARQSELNLHQGRGNLWFRAYDASSPGLGAPRANTLIGASVKSTPTSLPPSSPDRFEE